MLNQMTLAFMSCRIALNHNAKANMDMVMIAQGRHGERLMRRKPNKGFSTKLSFKTYHHLKSKGYVE